MYLRRVSLWKNDCAKKRETKDNNSQENNAFLCTNKLDSRLISILDRQSIHVNVIHSTAFFPTI